MKPTQITLIAICLMLVSVVAPAQQLTQREMENRTSRVKIYAPTDPVLRGKLIALLGLDHFLPGPNGTIETEIGADDIRIARKAGYRVDILIEDIHDYLIEQNQQYELNKAAGRVAFEQPGNTISTIITTPSTFKLNSAVFGGYYSYDTMVAHMQRLADANPTLVQKFSLGNSHESRAIWCMKISDAVTTPNDATEPDCLFIGLQHAREAITGASMIFFMEYLVEQYNLNNPKVRDLVNNREIYIVPCFNPDGWEYNRLNGGVGADQRKNRRNVGSDAGTSQKGVDLNRNWGVDWSNCGQAPFTDPIMGDPNSCGSDDPNMSTYWGTSAFSEPETNALRTFVKTKNFVVAFDQHAFGPYYSLPYGRRIAGRVMPQKQVDFYKSVPALMGKYNGMRANDSWGALHYEVAGGFKDWMLMGEIGVGTKDTVMGMTGEGAAGGGTSGNMFWAPFAQIETLCKSMCYQNLQLALSAGSYADIQDNNDSLTLKSGGNISFTLKRVGLANQPITVNLIPYQNMKTGGSIASITIPAYYGEYTGSIPYTLYPSIDTGVRVRYIWEVQTAGITYRDTVTKIYNPDPAFLMVNQNMESVANWTFTGGFGQTAAGTGYGGGTSRAISESPSGLYATNALARATYNTPINLVGATAAYLSFYTKHYAENFRDKMIVEYSTTSTNGVNGTWIALKGSHTIQEPGTLDGSTINGIPSMTGIQDYWVREFFDLTPAFGSNNVRFRFTFTSDGDPGNFEGERDEGFLIDNLSVIKGNAVQVVLGVNFLSFTGTLLPSKEVELKWDAVTDHEHSYFVVERSTDQRNWSPIGRVEANQPYKLNDRNPAKGSNYYRLKAVDINGVVQYSKVINIMYKTNMFTMSFYPNPVETQLFLNVKTETPEKLYIEINDLSGKKVYAQDVLSVSTGRTIQIDTRTLAAQMYIIKVVNSKNELLATEKFIKQ
jgi:carboxypeptidase T